MANTLIATVKIHGEENDRALLLQYLTKKGVYLEVHDDDETFCEAEGEFRWDLNVFYLEDVQEFIKKTNTVVEAYGIEPGIAFFQQVGVSPEGLFHDETIDLVSYRFPKEEETK